MNSIREIIQVLFRYQAPRGFILLVEVSVDPDILTIRPVKRSHYLNAGLVFLPKRSDRFVQVGNSGSVLGLTACKDLSFLKKKVSNFPEFLCKSPPLRVTCFDAVAMEFRNIDTLFFQTLGYLCV